MSLKNILRRVIASIIAVYMVFGNFAIAGIGLSQVIAEDTQTPEVAVEQTIQKYVQYSKEGYTGVAVQTSIKVSEIATSENYLPVSQVDVKVQVPNVNGILPSRVNIITAKTMLTNGKEKGEISQTYNNSTGLLNISYQNSEEELDYRENVKDEFEIIYIYPADAYVMEDNYICPIEQTTTAEVTYNSGNKVAKTETLKQEETQNEGEIANYEILSTSPIYKGNMYLSEKNKSKNTTSYTTTSQLSVLNSEIIDEIKIELATSEYTYIQDEEEKELNTDTIVYQSSKITEADFNKLFGQDGYIDFYVGKEKYATIQYSQADENGNKTYSTVYYTDGNKNIEAGKVEYPEGITNVTIITSKPQTEGIITVENEKQINAVEDYGKSVSKLKAIKEIRKIETTKTYKEKQEIKDENGNIQTEEIEKTTQINSKTNIGKIELKEPTTQVDLSVDNTNLSTLAENNIIITATLRTDSIQYSLFTNPVIQIELPEGIEKVSAKDVQLLYGENTLKLEKAQITDNKIITIELSGEQDKYNIGAIQEGASIVLPLTIKFNMNTPMQKTTIELTANNNGEKSTSTVDVNLVSKNGLMTITELSGYNGDNSLTVIDNQQQDAILETEQHSKTATLKATLVNNYDKNLTNVVVLGKISEENSDNNIMTTLKDQINVNKNAKIYYSEDINADATSDAWVEKVSDFSKVKSYMIILNNIQAKEIIQFGYEFVIPENLEYNKKTSVKYDVYYNFEDEKTEESDVTSKQETVEINIKTPEVPEIGLQVTPNISLDYVHEGQIVEYSIKITNNSKEAVEKLIIEDIIPENAIYTEYKETSDNVMGDNYSYVYDDTVKTKQWTIQSIEPGKTVEEKILVKVKNIESDSGQLINIVNATLQTNDNTNLKIATAESNIEIKKTKLDINFDTEFNSNAIYKEGNIITYYAEITNITNDTLKDIEVQDMLSQELEYQEGYVLNTDTFENYEENKGKEAKYDEDTRMVSWDIGNIKAQEKKIIVLKIKLVNIPIGDTTIYNNIVVNIGKTEKQESKGINIYTKKSDINVEITSTSSSNILEGDTISYKIKITNATNQSSSVTVNDTFSEELTLQKIIYYSDDGENVDNIQYTNAQSFEGTIDLEKNTAKVIELVCVANNLNDDVTETEVSNFVTISYENITKTSNIIKTVIEQKEDESEDTKDPTDPGNSEDSDNPSDPSKPDTKTYSIRGTAWLDANKDGKRDSNETLLSNINVYITDAITGEFVKNEDGTNYTVATGEDGTYVLKGLKEGSYIVVFEYDTNTYTVTTYQKSGIDESINSDVINKNIIINGESKRMALTDALELTTVGQSNIDIGLIENAIFDLSLDKQISSITVTNAQGTKTTEYNNENFAKVDLVAKYMNNTNVIINYKFVITNNGDVTGYVDELVDNLPSGLEFSSELNKDWYRGSDGNLYTTSLSGVAIAPGETSEVELILTKQTTEETTGTFSNNAELTEISNIEAIQEKQEAIENNKSSADVIISIKTGSAILYIGITLGCLAVIIAGTYIIKKKVLAKDI